MTNKREDRPGDDSGQDSSSPLRSLPQVDRLASALPSSWPHPLRVQAARSVIKGATEHTLAGRGVRSFDQLVDAATELLQRSGRQELKHVINATGVILHTNLGRAPLWEGAGSSMVSASAQFTNLEYDLDRADRGSRYDHTSSLIRNLTGAEDAVVVNNNAAATLLALRALAAEREVVVSRGELVEIGGEFRLPDVLAESGARMREVGTTNRTHLADYERAIGPDTGAVLKVHTSNFQVVGFTKEVSSAELARLCGSRDVAFINDLGSGLLSRKVAGGPPWLSAEPAVDEAVAEGADIVCFSGDKLLGGPQCGIICGSSKAIAALRKQPLLRALRVDKVTLAALAATLDKYLRREEADLPVWQMALADTSSLSDRAHSLVTGLESREAKFEIVEGHSTFGGGAAPGSKIPTVLIEISPRHTQASALFRGLVDNDPPIITRVANDRVIIDLRTVFPPGDSQIASALQRLL